MNYKNKKYLSEDRWSTQNLNKADFFLLAQLKSCNSRQWIDIQKKLQKIDLKLKFISFKDLKNRQFFSVLKSDIINNLLKGRLVLIYSETQANFPISLINFIKTTKILRSFVLYSDGRFVNINSDIFIREVEKFDLLQWNNFLNKFNNLNLFNIFDVFKDSYLELLGFQYRVFLNAITYKS